MELTARQQAYCDRVGASLEGLEAVSTGICPGCYKCADNFCMEQEEFEEAWASGDICEEASFSNYPCGICGCNLGGDRSAWHFILDGEIHHEDDACTDCVLFLANGDVPDDEYLDWLD